METFKVSIGLDPIQNFFEVLSGTEQYVPVVQRIEHGISNPMMGVRFPPGTHDMAVVV